MTLFHEWSGFKRSEPVHDLKSVGLFTHALNRLERFGFSFHKCAPNFIRPITKKQRSMKLIFTSTETTCKSVLSFVSDKEDFQWMYRAFERPWIAGNDQKCIKTKIDSQNSTVAPCFFWTCTMFVQLISFYSSNEKVSNSSGMCKYNVHILYETHFLCFWICVMFYVSELLLRVWVGLLQLHVC